MWSLTQSSQTLWWYIYIYIYIYTESFNDYRRYNIRVRSLGKIERINSFVLFIFSQQYQTQFNKFLYVVKAVSELVQSRSLISRLIQSLYYCIKAERKQKTSQSLVICEYINEIVAHCIFFLIGKIFSGALSVQTHTHTNKHQIHIQKHI